MQPINLLVENILLRIPKFSSFGGLILYFAWINLCNWIGLSSKLNLLTTALIAYLLTTDCPKRWAIIAHTFPRDFKAIKLYLRFQWIIFRFSKYENSVVKTFQKWVKQNPNKPCFLFEDEVWSYKKVDEYANRVANVFLKLGYKRGDVVALLMENRLEYVCIWLGLAKLGVITALINYNLKHQSLIHSITISQSKAVIFSAEFKDAVEDVKDSLDSNLDYFIYGENKTNYASTFSSLLEDVSTSAPPTIDFQPTDRLIYIFTSGTTGLPKAAVISHLRYFFISTCGYLGCCLNNDDRFYVPLPLYHSAGGVIGIGQAVCYNVPVAIRKKFSASQFWEDCVKFKCTVSQYIGETCRYLMAQPIRSQETAHSIRVLIGNGLRVQMWDEFISRFRIKDILELYGSTEGNANMANLDNTKGAVGFQPRAPKFLTPYMLIRVDKESGKPIRDENGLCIQCLAGEPGELVGRINTVRTDRHFDGYVNKSDSEKKIYEDVFEKGVKAFASGDLLVMDKYGYFYFKDRTGDTFRWKGENVSTAEVEDVIGKLISLKECVVYGVEVPGNEGRAGMVAFVDPENTINLTDLALKIEKLLPSYSRPVFVRITDSIPMTSTFKLKKLELQKEGFNPSECRSDRLYYCGTSGRYEIIDPRIYSDICNGAHPD